MRKITATMVGSPLESAGQHSRVHKKFPQAEIVGRRDDGCCFVLVCLRKFPSSVELYESDGLRATGHVNTFAVTGVLQ